MSHAVGCREIRPWRAERLHLRFPDTTAVTVATPTSSSRKESAPASPGLPQPAPLRTGPVQVCLKAKGAPPPPGPGGLLVGLWDYGGHWPLALSRSIPSLPAPKVGKLSKHHLLAPPAAVDGRVTYLAPGEVR